MSVRDSEIASTWIDIVDFGRHGGKEAGSGGLIPDEIVQDRGWRGLYVRSIIEASRVIWDGMQGGMGWGFRGFREFSTMVS